MQLSYLQCWLKISENLIQYHSYPRAGKPIYTVINPISLHATYPTCSGKLFNQVVLYISIYIMYVYMYMQTGASEETTYSHSLEFSLSLYYYSLSQNAAPQKGPTGQKHWCKRGKRNKVDQTEKKKRKEI